MLLPPIVYVLSSPRSGSTLLRVMMAGHSKLFSPPELNLLPFCTLTMRDLELGANAHTSIDCDQRDGLIEAVMNLANTDASKAERWVRRWIDCGLPICGMYDALRKLASPRALVDKSTLNASSIHNLFRSTIITSGALYIHLVRHPASTIESLMRNYFSRLPVREAFETAQELWRVPNENILRFLASIPPRQQFGVRYEELVKDPAHVLSELCSFLGIRFEEALLRPYEGQRMTRGVSGVSHSVGDPSFNSHTKVEASLADAWTTIRLPRTLDLASESLATHFGYTSLVKQRERGAELGNETVVLVVPPFSYRTEAYVSAARKLGLNTIVAVDPQFGLAEGIQTYIPISFAWPECAACAVAEQAAASKAKAILAIDDGAVEVAALASKMLRLPHNDAQGVQAANDKHTMRLLLAKAQVPSPEFAHHWMCEDPARISKGLDFPVVLKPLYLSGSRGVIRANNQDEFVTAFRRLCRLLEQPGTGPKPTSCLVEEYIPGVEVSLEGILVDGKLWMLGLYDKPDPLEGPYFEETMLITPSRLSADLQESIRDCAQRALDAVGLRVGPVHVELRCNEHGPWIVELAARTVGGHCSRALPFRDGLTLEELVLSHAVGLDTSRFTRVDGAHGVMMIPNPGQGIFRGVQGIADAEAVPNVTGVMIAIDEGTLITPLPEGHKYVGFIFANGETPEGVEEALRQAHKHLAFELEENSSSLTCMGTYT